MILVTVKKIVNEKRTEKRKKKKKKKKKQSLSIRLKKDKVMKETKEKTNSFLWERTVCFFHKFREKSVLVCFSFPFFTTGFSSLTD